MSLQGDLQHLARDTTLHAYSFDGDILDMLDSFGVAAGPLDGRVLAYAQTLDSTIKSVPAAWDYLLNTLGQASLNLQFAGASTLDSRITFSRASTVATRVNSAGLIETLTTDQPRFDYDPVTLAPRGLLIEEARTNILTYSNDLSSATGAWTPTLGTAVISGTAPDGTDTATLFTPSAGTAQHYVSRTTPAISNATAYSFSVFAKSNGKNIFSIYCASMPASGTAWFTLTGAGTVSNLTAGVKATIQAFPNGWYLCTYTGTTSSASTVIELHTGSTLGNFSDVANGTDGVYLWGAQFETTAANGAAPFSTSLIPTTTAEVTRAADVASMTGTNFSSWFNATEGTFVGSWDISNLTTDSMVFQADDGASTYAINFRRNASNQCVFRLRDGTTKDVGSITVPAVNTPVKMCGAYSTTLTNTSAVNGVVSGSSASVTSMGCNALRIGAAGINLTVINGHIQRLTYFNKRLPDATLKAMST